MEYQTNIYFGGFFVLTGCFLILGLFIPKFRLVARRDPKLIAGWCVHVGFAILFICGGVLGMIGNPNETQKPYVMAIVAVGWATLLYGHFFQDPAIHRAINKKRK